MFEEYSHKFLFVSPQVTQLLKLSEPDDCRLLLEPLRPDQKRLILFPVNDNESSESGGTHWSLLVYSKAEDTFFSFDSMKDVNINSSMKLVQRLQKGLRRPIAELEKHDCLQQTNIYDCGIHVLCNAENVCNHFLEEGIVRNTPKGSASGKRREILELIIRLASNDNERDY